MTNSPSNNIPWYKDGLRFKCTGCGKCCTGSPGVVEVSEEEIRQIASSLNMQIDQFCKKYVRKVGNRLALIEYQNPKHSKNYDCVFLQGKLCQIYSVRPKQCRTFPWWKENVQSKSTWKETASYCEGINHPDAPLISLEEIQKGLSSN